MRVVRDANDKGQSLADNKKQLQEQSFLVASMW
jgi:hypothetical protein